MSDEIDRAYETDPTEGAIGVVPVSHDGPALEALLLFLDLGECTCPCELAYFLCGQFSTFFL